MEMPSKLASLASVYDAKGGGKIPHYSGNLTPGGIAPCAGPHYPGSLIAGSLLRSGFASVREKFLIRFDKRAPKLRRDRAKQGPAKPRVSNLK